MTPLPDHPPMPSNRTIPIHVPAAPLRLLSQSARERVVLVAHDPEAESAVVVVAYREAHAGCSFDASWSMGCGCGGLEERGSRCLGEVCG